MLLPLNTENHLMSPNTDTDSLGYNEFVIRYPSHLEKLRRFV